MDDNRKIYSVEKINKYIKSLFDRDIFLNNIYIRGEISGCSYSAKGHIYFTLKDGKYIMPVAMWASYTRSLKKRLEDGMQVVVNGTVSVYAEGGRYQLIAKTVEEDGIGDIAAKLEELKKKLAQMGMFSAEYKKQIPRFSLKIGVVTSETGAVIRDIYNVASRRNPYSSILLYPAAVQGEGAKEAIAAGIRRLDKEDVDTIIIGRGGGSAEDLWAFNEEEVAMAIFECSKPVISAVGHETDFTIADMVADLRAPTPSAAAELAVFDYEQFAEDLENIKYTLRLKLDRRVDSLNSMVKQYDLKLKTLSPENQLTVKKQDLRDKDKQVKDIMSERLRRSNERARLVAGKLEGLSPLKRLSEGYSFCTVSSGEALKSIEQVQKGDMINIRVTDGLLDANISDIKEVKNA